MNHHFDTRETRDPRQRELDLMGHLPGLVAKALKAPRRFTPAITQLLAVAVVRIPYCCPVADPMVTAAPG